MRQAEERDFPAIESWRAAHFLEMAARGSKRPVTEQADLSSAAWVVYCDEDDQPLAAMGFRDEPQIKRRWVSDLYAASGRAGLRAGMILGRMVEEMSDSDGYEVHGLTDPENTDYLQHLVGRGYEITSIAFRRVPHGRPE